LAFSNFKIGAGATPAVHNTVALSIRLPATMTPWWSTFSTSASVRILTPSRPSRLAAFRDSDSAKLGRMRLAPSSKMIEPSAQDRNVTRRAK
jgi:hypothetical protein